MHTKLKKSVLATACAAALLGLAAMPASATEWTGTSSNDWFDAGNWNPSAIPGATDPVVIDTIGSGVEIGAAGALADRVVVGDLAEGSLVIRDGGTLETGSLQPTQSVSSIGRAAGSTGTVTVTGENSAWTNARTIFVGEAGNGTLAVENGGRVTTVRATIGRTDGGNGTLTVSGNQSVFENSRELIIGSGGDGALIVQSGTVISGSTIIGDQGDSTGSALVEGNESVWNNDGALIVGNAGSGTLSVKDGGRVNTLSTLTVGSFPGGNGVVEVAGGGKLTSSNGVIGAVATTSESASGTVKVDGVAADGTASTWTNTGDLTIGRAGSGSLDITNGAAVFAGGNILVGGTLAEGQSAAGDGTLTLLGGGKLEANGAAIGASAGSSGEATVDGENSQILLHSGLIVGLEGAGTLAIRNGASVVSLIGAIGSNLGGNGVVTIDNGTWNITQELVVGGDEASSSPDGGEGELTIGSGGVVTSEFGLVGSDAGSVGMVAVNGGSWATVQGVAVGMEGTGSLTISAGGKVSGGVGILGNGSGSSGTATVTGQDSLWSSTGDFAVGVEGDGALAINDGGKVGVAGFFTVGMGDGNGALTISNGGQLDIGGSSNIGFFSGSEGAATVTSGGIWTTAGTLTVGNAGNGRLDVLDGGQVTTGLDLIIGFGESSTGSVVVDDASLTTRALFVGNSGNGTLTVRNGAVVNSENGIVNGIDGAAGTAIVEGSGSTWNNNHDGLFVGLDGTGVLTIREGGHVGSGFSVLGQDAGSSGRVTIEGAGSNWTSGDMFVGFNGDGVLDIRNGGSVQTSGSGLVGEGAGDTTGAVTVSGAGSTWALTGELGIGLRGTGVLTIRDTATVNASAVALTDEAGATGTLNIGAAIGEAAVGAGTLDAPTLTFGSGTGTLNFNHTDSAYAFDTAIGGNGTVNVLAGTTVFTAANNYTGSTNVSGGTLRVDGALSGSEVTVSSGGALGGSGTISGEVNIGSGGRLFGTGTLENVVVSGTVAPGDSIGTLTVDGNYTQAAGSTYEAEINAADQSDRIVIGGTATLSGGTVDVVGLAGPIGTRYTLLTAAGGVNGQFSLLDVDAAPTPFLDMVLTYAANAVYLDVARSATTFASVGATRNHRAAGAGLDSLAGVNPLIDAVAALDVPQVRAALDQLSGEMHASAQGALVDDSRIVRGAVSDRLRAATGNESDADGIAAWVSLYGHGGDTDSDGNAAALKQRSDGLFVGADLPVDRDWRVGVLAGYGDSRFEAYDRAAQATSHDLQVGAYGGRQWNRFGVNLGAAYAQHDVDSTRQAAFAGFSDALTGRYDAETTQLFVEAGYRFEFGRASFEPFLALAQVELKIDGFEEQGGVAALAVTPQSTRTGFGTFGVNWGIDGGDAAGARWNLQGTLGWRHAFGDLVPESSMRFAGSDAFVVGGTPITEGALVADVLFGLQLSRTTAVSLGYTGQIGDEANDHGIKGRVQWQF